MQKDTLDTATSVFLLTNVASPYRLPLFERLSTLFKLDVYFCKEEKEYREWDSETDRFKFESDNLANFTIGPLIINYAIFSNLLTKDYDIFIAGDNRNHAFATIVTFLYAKLTGRSFVLWTGVTDIRFDRCAGHRSVRRRLFSNCVTVVSELYRRMLYAGADAFVAYSSNTREHLTERGVASDDIFVGGQVMPEECLPPRPQGNGSSDGEPESMFTITFLGYLQRRKGVQFLIEAYNSLTLPETKLQIAGSGTYQQQLEELAADNDSIEFLGYVEGRSKARCYIETDLFVLPTLQDPWGLVVNEAIYYDCPVMVTEAAGSADLVREANCGIVIKPGSVRALRQGIQGLYHDHDRRKRYVKNTQKATESTDVDIGVKPFREAIMTVMNRQSGSSKKSGNSCVE